MYKFWGYDSWSTTSFAISLFACSAITAEWKVESEGGRAEAVVNFSSIRYIKQGFEIDIKSIKRLSIKTRLFYCLPSVLDM